MIDKVEGSCTSSYLAEEEKQHLHFFTRFAAAAGPRFHNSLRSHCPAMLTPSPVVITRASGESLDQSVPISVEDQNHSSQKEAAQSFSLLSLFQYPPIPVTHAFTTNPLNRFNHHRKDEETMNKLLNSEEALFLPFHQLKPLLT